MMQEPRDLMVESLRSLQADMAGLKEGQRMSNRLFAAIEVHVAGFHVTVATRTDELTALKERGEHIERRLEPAD